MRRDKKNNREDVHIQLEEFDSYAKCKVFEELNDPEPVRPPPTGGLGQVFFKIKNVAGAHARAEY